MRLIGWAMAAAMLAAAWCAPARAQVQWAQVYERDFAAGEASAAGPEWSRRAVAAAPEGKRHFLGKFHEEAVVLHLAGLPAHKFLRVRLALIAIGQWTGEATWRLEPAGGPRLASGTISNADAGAEPKQTFPLYSPRARFAARTGSEGGAGRIIGGDSVYRVEVVFPHDAPAAELRLSAAGMKDADRQWWGVLSAGVDAAAAAPADEKALAAAWAALGSEAMSEGGRAMGVFVAAGEAGAATLLDRMTAVPQADTVRRLIAQTDDNRFAVREKATDAMIAMGRAIEPLLREALARKDISWETRNRLEKVLEAFGEGELPAGEGLRQMRAVDALRLAGPAAGLPRLRKLSSLSAWPQVRGAASEAADEVAGGEIARLLAASEAASAGGDFAAARARCAEAAALSKQAQHLASLEIDDALALVDRREKTAAQLDALRTRLKADARDAMARVELVRLLAGEMDRPTEAATWLSDTLDAKLREMVTLAARRPQDVPQHRRLDLARWYRALAPHVAAPCRRPLLRRAGRLVELYLAGETAAAARRAAEQELADLRQDALAAEALGEGWLDLLRTCDLARNRRAGEWKRDGRALKLAAGPFGSVEMPVAPAGSYELRVQFNRAAGRDGIFVAVPAGDHRGDLNISGWDGSCSGLEWIDAKEANANETTVKPPRIVNGRNHLLVVTVTLKGDDVQVVTTLDGKPYVKWTGRPGRLATASAWNMPDGTTFGLGAHQCDVTFLSARLKMLDGKWRLAK